MEALLVIDVQNGIVEFGDFKDELALIKNVIEDFKGKGKPVIFIRHFDDVEESPLYKGSAGSELHPSIKGVRGDCSGKEDAEFILQDRIGKFVGGVRSATRIHYRIQY